jgi:hypothetical protein
MASTCKTKEEMNYNQIARPEEINYKQGRDPGAWQQLREVADDIVGERRASNPERWRTWWLHRARSIAWRRAS